MKELKTFRLSPEGISSLEALAKRTKWSQAKILEWLVLNHWREVIAAAERGELGAGNLLAEQIKSWVPNSANHPPIPTRTKAGKAGQ